MPTPFRVTDQSPLLQQDVACIYCHTDVAVNDQVMLCDVCHSPHHLDCWQANSKRCATFGCAGAETAVTRPVVPPPPQRRRQRPASERDSSRSRGFPWWLLLIMFWGCSAIDDMWSSPPVAPMPPMPTAITVPISPLETVAMPKTSPIAGALTGEFITIEPAAILVAVADVEIGLVALDESDNLVRDRNILGSLENPIRTTTDESGKLVFELVKPGKYALFAGPPNEAERLISLHSGDDIFIITAGEINDADWLSVRPASPAPTVESSE